MAELSDYMENKIIEVMRAMSFTAVAAYVALFKSPVTDAELEAGTLTNEVSGGAYARQLAGLGVPSDGVSSNGADITFPTATADWGTVTHCALMDAATAGNVYMYSALDASKVVANGDTFKINAGELSVSIT